MAQAFPEIEMASTLKEENFWYPKRYVVVTKRTATGSFLCDQMRSMMQDLVNLYSNFAEGVEAWSRAWKAKIEKSGECGTTVTSAMLRFIEANQSVAAAHSGVATDLKKDAVTATKNWHRANYHKNFVGVIREADEIDDGFADSQAPWRKLLRKVDKAKLAYHNASKRVINAKHQESVACHDTSKAPDDLEQLRQKIVELEMQADDAKDNYGATLNSLVGYRQKYQENMEFHYAKADAIERKRLGFFEGVLKSSHGALIKLISGANLERIRSAFDSFDGSIGAIAIEADLDRYRADFGAGMPLPLPLFEEYTEILHQLSRGQKLSKNLRKNFVGGRSVTTFGLFQKSSSTLPSPSASPEENGPKPASFSGVTMIRYVNKDLEEDEGDVVDLNSNVIPGEKDKAQIDRIIEDLKGHVIFKEARVKKVGPVSPSVRRVDRRNEMDSSPDIDREFSESRPPKPKRDIGAASETPPQLAPFEALMPTVILTKATPPGDGEDQSEKDDTASKSLPATRSADPEIPDDLTEPAVANLRFDENETCDSGPLARSSAASEILTDPVPTDLDNSVFPAKVLATRDAEPSSFISSRYLKEDGLSETDPRMLSTCCAELTESEPEITLARGGSIMGGFVDSFDENLTMPSNGSPIQVSSNVKTHHPQIRVLKEKPQISPRGVRAAPLFTFCGNESSNDQQEKETASSVGPVEALAS